MIAGNLGDEFHASFRVGGKLLELTTSSPPPVAAFVTKLAAKLTRLVKRLPDLVVVVVGDGDGGGPATKWFDNAIAVEALFQ